MLPISHKAYLYNELRIMKKLKTKFQNVVFSLKWQDDRAAF